MLRTMLDLESVKAAHATELDATSALRLALSFLLGSFTSAFVTLKAKELPSVREICSSTILSGIIAVAFGAYLIEHGITTGMLIVVSILCGLGGDVLVRVLAGILPAIVKKFTK